MSNLKIIESMSYLTSLEIVFIVGFISAAVIGSTAWYNSKRPAGWEGHARPDIVPEIES